MTLLKNTFGSGRSKLPEAQIPYNISEYIKEHFQDDFLTDIKKEKDIKGDSIYKVDISSDDTYYHLTFDANGILIQKEMEPVLELGDDEFEITD